VVCYIIIRRRRRRRRGHIIAFVSRLSLGPFCAAIFVDESLTEGRISRARPRILRIKPAVSMKLPVLDCILIIGSLFLAIKSRFSGMNWTTEETEVQ
jgi:hypothetical protein